MSRKRSLPPPALTAIVEARAEAFDVRAGDTRRALADAMRIASALDAACDAIAYEDSLAAVWDKFGIPRSAFNPESVMPDYFRDMMRDGEPLDVALRNFARAGTITECECADSGDFEALAYLRLFRGLRATARLARALARYVEREQAWREDNSRSEDLVIRLATAFFSELRNTELARELVAIDQRTTEPN